MTEFKTTGKFFIATNGKVFAVYSKMTKKGVRFYKMNRDGRMLPLSKNDIS